jgi:hypothetical protein
MKIRSFFLILLMVSLFAAINANAQSGAGKGKGRLRGEVGDEQKHPLADVTVKFTNERLQTSFEVKTNEKGEWVVNGVAGGNWNIDFVKEGYETKSISYPIQQMEYNKPVVLEMKKQSVNCGRERSGG